MQVMQGNDFISRKLRPLSYKLIKYVIRYNGYNVNDFKFHMQQYEKHKSIMNNDVCIKSSWLAKVEND